MRIFFRSMTAALSLGLIGLLFVPLLKAQEYPADIRRGKAVYERQCQACHGVGGWGMDRTRRLSRWRRPIFTDSRLF